MKKYLFLVMTLVLVSCTDQMVVDEVAGEHAQQTSESNVATLMEKARWGDGQAYVKLADCYRDGKGVKQDFINMLAMASFADDYGGIERMEDYLSALPEDSEYKIVFDAMEKFSGNKQEEGLAMAEELIKRDCAEGYAVKGIILSEQGNREEGKPLLERATEKGSGFANLYLCMSDLKGTENPDIARLTALAERMPLANACLGKIYSGKNDESKKDERLAAYYYMKADEKACLPKDGARWLLAYHRNGGNLQLGKKDIERLELLADSPKEEPVNIRHRDSVLETGIALHLEQDQEEYKIWSKAIVYVVETKTGKIKANVSYERKGDSFVPCTDTYNEEQSVMECGSTYLALLSTGKVTPKHVYNTGAGVYGNVRDHNWRRGGYGTISLERALEVRSQIAFTMAKEQVFGGNTSEFDDLIYSYLGGWPNCAFGILTFYNAVANGGKMVELVSEGVYGNVIQEQIAQPQYIKELQVGLEHSVSQGLMRKAGRDYVKVSACGRTFNLTDNYRRMELCGYFPSDNPLYTIMVILEKEGLPASASGMCGPIFAHTVDLLVELYRLEPMCSSAFEEETDEIVEIVDTVAVQ